MKILTTIMVIGAFIVGSTPVNGQSSQANNSYSQYSYQKAIAKYNKTLAKNENDGEAIFNLANSYRLNGESTLAEQWYAQAIAKDGRPLSFLHYGQTLMMNGKYDQAKQQFLHFAGLASHTNDQQTARSLAQKCDDLKKGGIPDGTYWVEPVPFNTEFLDFSPTYYGEHNLVFVSNRPESRSKMGSRDPWTDMEFVDMFSVNILSDSNEFGTPKPVKGNLNGNFHEGPMTFSPDGKIILFTRNDYRGKRGFDNEDNTRLKIFQGHFESGQWKMDEELPFNSSQFSTAHPALSQDGDLLVFASDRPGGYGEMDLYVSMKVLDTWGEPVNLGPKINSSGNEVFPFVGTDQKLYFSSDFNVGYGGLDVYSATRNGIIWENVTNMGAPINSPRDDFGLIINEAETDGYFSSNRSGKDDDIYHFASKKGRLIRGRVILCNTEEVIPDIDVTVGGNNFTTLDLVSDDEGAFSFSAPENKTLLEVTAIEEGYITTEGCPNKVVISSNNDAEVILALIDDPFFSKGARTISGKVINAKYGTPLANTKIKLINRCTGEVYETTTDNKGRYQVPAPEDCDYVLQANKPNFKPALLPLSTIGRDPNEGLEQDVPLVFDETGIPGLVPSGTILSAGLVIELEHIYFDYDEYFIRKDAIAQLKELLELLRKNPSVVGELRAHTDSRAPVDYNITLSQNRAKAARDWLVLNGIESNRLSFRGYGESVLRNECADGIPCDEFKHQRNRRVEFYVISNDGKKVESKEAPQYKEK